MRFDLDELPQIGSLVSEGKPDGKPLQLLVADIDEDPKQPRSEFDLEPLQQLAASIKQRGVLQAISVRRHPDNPERWMLNFGARRLRASKLAGLNQIPATVNETASSYDQVIENEQREGLKPLELALFVQSRIAMGESQADIARQMGKSAPFVTYATALIDAPDWLMVVYREGKCRGVTELHQLRKLHAQNPQRVQAWIDRQVSISRSDIQRLKVEIGQVEEVCDKTASVDAQAAVRPLPSGPAQQALPENKFSGSQPVVDGSAASTPPGAGAESRDQKSANRTPGHGDLHSAIRLLAEFKGQTVEIVLDSMPQTRGHVLVRMPEAAQTTEVSARELVLVGWHDVRES